MELRPISGPHHQVDLLCVRDSHSVSSRILQLISLIKDSERVLFYLLLLMKAITPAEIALAI